MAETDAKETAEVSIEELALLITSASQLLTHLAAATPFKTAGMGLAEWVSFSVLANKNDVSNKQLARALGVTGQRANQLCTSLAGNGLITIQQSTDDRRRNIIKVTAKGKKQVAALNAELQVLLGTALKGREKTLTGAVRYLWRLTRLLQAASSTKAPPAKPVR